MDFDHFSRRFRRLRELRDDPANLTLPAMMTVISYGPDLHTSQVIDKLLADQCDAAFELNHCRDLNLMLI